jgi:hypothetical protein
MLKWGREGIINPFEQVYDVRTHIKHPIHVSPSTQARIPNNPPTDYVRRLMPR